MSLYVESSSLLCYLYGESRFEKVMQILESHESIVTSQLTMIETERTLTKDYALGKMNELQHRYQNMLLRTTTSTWQFLELTPTIRKRAGEKFPIEPVRNLDAIHLSSMLEAVELYPDLKVLSFDERILENVKMLGLPEA